MNQVSPVSPTRDECNLAMLAHLLGVFTGFVGALILWLVKRDESAFVGDQAREALNFQITIALGAFASTLLAIFLIGIPLLMLILAANFVLSIIAALAASQGRPYRYPFTLRLVR